MMQVLPFRGLLPSPERVAQVAAVPYDVVSREEAAALAAGNPLSFLHVSRPEIDLPATVDIHDVAVYALGAENFRRLRATAPLVADAAAHLYVYELTMAGRQQTGVVGVVSAAEYDAGLIKKHEKTRQDKEDDRARHLLAVRSHTGPVFLAYRDSADITGQVSRLTVAAPTFDFTAPDGIRHRFWRVPVAESQSLSQAFRAIPCLYIADGHHRAAAAARAAALCRERNPEHTGREDYNFFLAVAFPDTQLRILPYNRAVRDLNGLTPAALLARIATAFTISSAKTPEPDRAGEFGMYLAGAWHRLRPRFATAGLDPIHRLDVSLLQDHLLAPVLGIADPRTSDRIDFIGGIRGVGELQRLVDSGRHAVAFAMFPTSLAQLFAVADAGAIMPPKSTWFEPKLRDGLVCHDF